MPYLEILGPPADTDAKAKLTHNVTEAIMAGFGVGPETVTIYFLPISPGDYAHAGQLGGGPGQRILVKIHAFRRDVAKRRDVARAVTEAIALSLAANPDAIAVYFLDRDRDEVAHAGHLASD